MTRTDRKTLTEARRSLQTAVRAALLAACMFGTAGTPAWADPAVGEQDALRAPSATRTCASTRATYERLQNAYRAIAALGLETGAAGARIDSGRPADADSWLPRNQDGGDRITVGFDHATAVRLMCGVKPDVACTLCAWNDATELGPRVSISLTGAGTPSLLSATDQVLVATLNARAVLRETTQHAAVSVPRVPN